MWQIKIPKIELHCHLDGSISLETLKLLAKESAVILPDGEKNIMQLMRASNECKGLGEYLKAFDLPLRCMSTPKSLEIAAYNLLREVSGENVRYIEVRFAPLLSVNDNMSCRTAIESVLKGLKAGKEHFNVQASAILCGMRHHTVEQNIVLAKVAKEYLGNGVCGLDLAGDEILYPCKIHLEFFQYAKKEDIPFTAHAGECGSSLNVADAIMAGAKRIGHGIAIQNDRSSLDLCLRNRIGIEMCPSSNLQTKAVKSWGEYPFNMFLDKGLNICVNTDNRTVSNTSMSKELFTLQRHCKIDSAIAKRLMFNAIEVAFASDQIKHELWKELSEWTEGKLDTTNDKTNYGG